MTGIRSRGQALHATSVEKAARVSRAGVRAHGSFHGKIPREDADSGGRHSISGASGFNFILLFPI